MNSTAWQSNRKVLFLDYDGVVHRGEAYRTRRGIVSSDPSRIKLFEYADVLAEMLAPYEAVEIVLSTTWVKVLGFNRARAALPLEELRDKVAGATYHTHFHDAQRWYDIPRGQQVLRYVRNHRLARWLALDDRSDGFESVKDNLVLCDPAKALGNKDTQEALRMRLVEIFRGTDPLLGTVSSTN
ncbi:HAD domain-containing protein [Caballeronia sp. NCTM5]|uniref:HAD domain-containing protein n=1 Tax=Caballeronia sp. NCTM5 TaxID=2921755 RepID=UPI0020289814|nr:HAD domain-containing protein [Caballeronia sp. NCTM5]